MVCRTPIPYRGDDACADPDDAPARTGTSTQKKRDQGRTHSQAVIALTRRRIDVLWALLHVDRHLAPARQQELTQLDNTIEIPSAPTSDRSVGSRPRSWTDSMGLGNPAPGTYLTTAAAAMVKSNTKR